MSMRSEFVQRVKGWLGWPYVWGSQSPISGFDCSGLVTAALWAIGYWPLGKDYNAQKFHDAFLQNLVRYPYAGCLVFWKNDKSEITHVEICLGEDDHETIQCIGARKSKGMVIMTPLLEIRGKIRIAGYADPFMNGGHIIT